jgi:hypothetical protein
VCTVSTMHCSIVGSNPIMFAVTSLNNNTIDNKNRGRLQCTDALEVLSYDVLYFS